MVHFHVEDRPLKDRQWLAFRLGFDAQTIGSVSVHPGVSSLSFGLNKLLVVVVELLRPNLVRPLDNTLFLYGNKNVELV